MDKRLDASKSGCQESDLPGHSKKNKKKSSKKNSVLGSWVNNVHNDHVSDAMPGMEYQHVMWPPNVQQNFANNGRRLFPAASDPSVCGYTPMPMTYAMEPVSLPPMYRLYPSVPFPGMKNFHPAIRRQCHQNTPMNMGLNVHSMPNGYTSLQENGSDSPMHAHYQNGDYTSLPPTANKNHGINGDELSSEHRRYSDPGLGSAEAPARAHSDESDSEDSGSSTATIGRNNKLVLSLIEQMTELKKTNSQLFKELNETKSELENVKATLIHCKHSSSSDYQPGMLSDLIQEIREANKACEESLVAKVRSLVDETINQKSSEVEKLNNQLLKLIKEKEESDRRVTKLEADVTTLKVNANNEGREIAAFEEETLALRRELQEARASRTLAENHAAKCVNALARSVTPVSFEPPSITSTPVRTAISDTCSLIPLASPTSSVPQTFTTNARSRAKQEVAHHFAPERPLPSFYRTTTDCSTMPVTAVTANPSTYDDESAPWTAAASPVPPVVPLLSLPPIPPSPTDRENNQPPEFNTSQPPTLPSEKPECYSNNPDNILTIFDAKVDQSNHARSVIHEDTQETSDPSDKITSDLLGLSIDSDSARDTKERCVEQEEEADRYTAISSCTSESRSVVGEKPLNSVGDADRKAIQKEWEKSELVQKGSVKKPRRKRAGGTAKRSYSDADRPKKNEIQELGPLAGASASAKESSCAWKDDRRTVSEDEDCLNDDRASRAITEIPEVAVVGGGSFVPKDLCSAGILTSRVLTAPSRATYTTAYI